MTRPSTTILPSAPPTVPWLPALGVVLALLAVVLRPAGMAEIATPALPGVGTSRYPLAGVAMPAPVAPSPRHRSAGTRISDRAPFGTADFDAADQERPNRPSDCLGADLAAGRRAESAHLATIALQRPGDCGDLREAFRVMAAAHPVRHRTALGPYASDVAPNALRANSDNRITVALFGPALPQSSADEHELTPHGPPEEWDARWDLFEMAGAQRGDWTRQCPCPVYVDNPAGVPR
jgi:hypothetical protein